METRKTATERAAATTTSRHNAPRLQYVRLQLRRVPRGRNKGTIGHANNAPSFDYPRVRKTSVPPPPPPSSLYLVPIDASLLPVRTQLQGADSDHPQERNVCSPACTCGRTGGRACEEKSRRRTRRQHKGRRTMITLPPQHGRGQSRQLVFVTLVFALANDPYFSVCRGGGGGGKN